MNQSKPEKFLSKFTLIFTGLILLTFFVFWIYKFGVFTPQRGTSTASASALWGQFIVSLLAVVVFDAILVFLDVRKRAVPIFKLVSFWLIIIIILSASSLYAYKKISYGQTHTYQEGQEFRYGPYSFTVNGEFSDIGQQDCSGYIRLKQWCEEQNAKPQMDKYLTLKIKIKNDSSREQPTTTNRFEVIGNSGTQYNVPYNLYADAFGVKNLPSQATREGTLSKISVLKSEQEFNIEVILPNKAEQIVKIKSR